MSPRPTRPVRRPADPDPQPATPTRSARPATPVRTPPGATRAPRAAGRPTAPRRQAATRRRDEAASGAPTPQAAPTATTPTAITRTATTPTAPTSTAPASAGASSRLPAAHALYRARVSAGSVRRFAERARRRRLRAALPVLVAGALVVVLAVTAWVVLGSPWLRADEVRVAGAQRVQQAQVDSAIGDQLGRPLARVDTAVVEERLERLSAVRSAQVVRVWPSTLDVRLTERVPVAAVPGEGGVALVDDSGVVVETVPEPPAGLAVVSEDTVAAGGPALEAAVTVLRTMPEDLRASVAGTSAATPDSVTLALSSGAQVVWGSADESERKAAVLRILLARPAQVYDVSAPGTPVTR